MFNKSDFEHLGKAFPPGCGMDRLGKRGGPEGDEEDYFEEALDQEVEGRQEEELIIMKTILAWLQHCWICLHVRIPGRRTKPAKS